MAVVALGWLAAPAVWGVPKLEWTLRSGDPVAGKEILYATVLETGGNLLAVGWANGPTDSAWLARRYSPKGEQLWQDPFNGDGRWTACYAAVPDKKGGFALVGEQKPAEGGKNWLVRRYDRAGSLVWSRSHANEYGTNSWVQSAIFDSNGDLVVGGGEDLPQKGRVWRLIKYGGKNGEEAWSRMFTGPAQEDDGADIIGMAPAGEGEFYAVGFQHEATGGISMVVRKLTGAGRVAWIDTWAGTTQYADARGDRILVTPDGGIVVAGHELAGAWPDYDWVLRRYGPDGKVEWGHRFAGAGGKEDVPRGLARTPDGGLIMAGYETDGAGERVWMALGLNRVGRPRWKMSGFYSPYRCAFANGVAVAGDGESFFLAGGPSNGWLMRRYAMTGGVEAETTKFIDALFQTKSDELTEDAKRTLGTAVQYLLKETDLMVSVEGHADERGTAQENYELGLRRAERALDFMESAGIQRGRMMALSLGETAPIGGVDGPETWKRNRRVRISTVATVVEAPPKK